MIAGFGARCGFCGKSSEHERSGPRRTVVRYGRRVPWAALVDEDLRRGVLFAEHVRCRDKAVRRLSQVAADIAAAAGVFSPRALLAEALKRVGG